VSSFAVSKIDSADSSRYGADGRRGIASRKFHHYCHVNDIEQKAALSVPHPITTRLRGFPITTGAAAAAATTTITVVVAAAAAATVNFWIGYILRALLEDGTKERENGEMENG